MDSIKTRVFKDSNYKGIHLNGKTIRIALNPNSPITTLKYPEFFDVKVTSKCNGNCPYCYQNSLESCQNDTSIIEKFKSYFSLFDSNQKPFQIAFGGGEPTLHPLFPELLKECYNMGITPNYTTNGTWVTLPNKDSIMEATTKYCGGVAVSTHPHLKNSWEKTVDLLLSYNIHTNLHIIIGDRNSIDKFANIYKKYTGKIKYFVLLPLSQQGRSTTAFNDWEYLKSKIDGSPRDVAFGANFHPYLVKDKGRFNVSIYDPESMSAYLDLETMKVYTSSFSNQERKIG